MHYEYRNKLNRLEAIKNAKIEAANRYKKLQLDNINSLFEAAIKQATSEYETEMGKLKEKMVNSLMDRQKRLEEEHSDLGHIPVNLANFASNSSSLLDQEEFPTRALAEASSSSSSSSSSSIAPGASSSSSSSSSSLHSTAHGSDFATAINSGIGISSTSATATAAGNQGEPSRMSTRKLRRRQKDRNPILGGGPGGSGGLLMMGGSGGGAAGSGLLGDSSGLLGSSSLLIDPDIVGGLKGESAITFQAYKKRLPTLSVNFVLREDEISEDLGALAYSTHPIYQSSASSFEKHSSKRGKKT